MSDEELLNEAETVADGVTALVGVTDQGLRGAQAGLDRIAEGVGGLQAVIPDIGAAIGAAIGPALRDALAPTQGIPGRDGVDGGIGPIGPPGKDGRPGKDGVDGVDGIGLPGPAGKDGVPGKAGRAGVDGADAAVPVRVVAERDFQQRLEGAVVYDDDGSQRKYAVRRAANGKISELVRVSA